MLERARQAAAERLKQAADAGQKAAVAGAGKAAETLKDPVTHTKAKHAAKQAVTSAGIANALTAVANTTSGTMRGLRFFFIACFLSACSSPGGSRL